MPLGRYQPLLRNRSFFGFWLGFTVSVLGDGMTRVALTWFVYETTGSAEALGGLMFAYTAPIIVGGLLAASLLDRFDRRRVMLADNLIRGAVLTLIPLLHWLGWLALLHVYAAASVYGLLMMLSLAGGPALVPSLVPDEELPAANALEMLSFTLGGMVGPPLAGWLIPRLGAPNVVLFDVLSYLAFALALQRSRPRQTARSAGATPAGGLGAAVRLLTGNPILLATTLMFMTYNIGNGLFSVALPLLVAGPLGGDAALYGALLGLQAGGEVASSVLAGGIVGPSAPLGRLICLAQLVAGIALLIVLSAGNLWGVAAGVVLFGIASAPLTIWAQTLRMRIIPAPLRGRSFALLRTIMQSGNPLGGASGGLLLPLLGLPATLVLAALGAGLHGLLGLGVPALHHAHRPATPTPSAQPGELAG